MPRQRTIEGISDVLMENNEVNQLALNQKLRTLKREAYLKAIENRRDVTVSETTR